jgi:hypothetical protein
MMAASRRSPPSWPRGQLSWGYVGVVDVAGQLGGVEEVAAESAAKPAQAGYVGVVDVAGQLGGVEEVAAESAAKPAQLGLRRRRRCRGPA